MASPESSACGGVPARGRQNDAAPRRRRVIAAAVAALALTVAAGCGSDGDRNDVPASPIGGEDAGARLPSQEKLEKRSARARREAEKLRRQLKRTSRAAKRASK